MNRFLKPISLLLLVSLFLIGCEQKKAPPPVKTITIRLVHDADIAPLVRSMVERFEASSPSINDGRLVRVKRVVSNGFPAAENLAEGQTKTELWLAPSSSLVHWTNANLKNLGPKQTDCKTLFATPSVFVTRPENAKVFNASGQAFSWGAFFRARDSRLKELQTNASFVGLTVTPPRSSTTGLTSYLQLAQLAASNVLVSGAHDIASEATLLEVAKYQQLVSEYSDSENSILSRTASTVEGELRFALTTEQRLAQFNARRKQANPSLVALYPNEGSAWQDYNVCLSDADWVTPDKQAASRLLVEYLSGEEAQLSAKSAGFRPSIVQFEVTPPLVAKYGVNTSEPLHSFSPIAPKALQYLVDNWSKVRRPQATLLVLDASGSMEGEPLGSAQRVFRTLIARQNSEDQRALITFSSTTSLAASFTADKAKATAAIDEVQSLGGSSVYDGIRLAFQLLEETDLERYRKSIIVITDGGDKNSRYSKSRLKTLVRSRVAKQDVKLIVFALTDKIAAHNDLREISVAANGTFFELKAAELESKFENVT